MLLPCLLSCPHRRRYAGSTGLRVRPSFAFLCTVLQARNAICTLCLRSSSEMPTSRLQHFPLMVWGLRDGACRLGCGAPARFLLSTSSAWVFLFISSILRGCIRVFSRLANIFVLLAQGLERGSYEPDVTGSIPVWDMSIFGSSIRPDRTPVQKSRPPFLPSLHPLQTEGPPGILPCDFRRIEPARTP